MTLCVWIQAKLYGGWGWAEAASLYLQIVHLFQTTPTAAQLKPETFPSMCLATGLNAESSSIQSFPLLHFRHIIHC